MRKNILSNTLLATTFLLSVGCATKKQASTVAIPPAAISTSTSKQGTLSQLTAKDFSFNTLSLKGKSTIRINGNENDATLNLRIKKDQTIWFSVTALGGAIEAARGLITPDSILVMNRLQKTVLRKPFSYIYTVTNKEVTFQLLQSILVGNTASAFMQPDAQVQQEDGLWVIKGATGNLTYRTNFNNLLKPSEVTLFDAKAMQSLKTSYQNHKNINGFSFPGDFSLSSRAGEKIISASVSFSKIEVNVPVEFPFTVPKSFELIK